MLKLVHKRNFTKTFPNLIKFLNLFMIYSATNGEAERNLSKLPIIKYKF